MLQAEAEKLFIAERVLQRVLERKSLPAVVRSDITYVMDQIQQAISYEDDEPCRPSGDDD